MGAHVPRAPGFSLVAIDRGDAHALAFHAPAPPGAPTIVWLHGNGQELADLVPLLISLQRAGNGVYAVEYPGYGLRGDGVASEETVMAETDLALRHLGEVLGVPPSRTVLVGQSVGTGVAIELARRGFGAKVSLISPYTSYDALAARYGVPRALVDDHFDSLGKAASITQPVLIVVGSRDTLIPPAMAVELAERFPDAAIVWVPGGHHNDLFALAGASLVRCLTGFARL